jgi:hypothetical protein
MSVHAAVVTWGVVMWYGLRQLGQLGWLTCLHGLYVLTDFSVYFIPLLSGGGALNL